METKQMLDKVKGELSGVLSKVAGKAEHVAKISKLKLEIATRKSAINSCYQEIGEYIYGKKKEFPKDTFLADIFKEIEELNKKNETAKAAIEKHKAAGEKTETEEIQKEST
jgi:ubiquinone biosynthesis protein UbiJ